MQILTGRSLVDRMHATVWRASQGLLMASFGLAHVLMWAWHGVRPEAFPVTREQVGHHTWGTLLALYGFASVALMSIQFVLEEVMIFPALRQKYGAKGRRMRPIGADQVERYACSWLERVALNVCSYCLAVLLYLPTALSVVQNGTGGGFLVIVASGLLIWKAAAQEGIERLSPWEREFG